MRKEEASNANRFGEMKERMPERKYKNAQRREQ